MSGTLRHVALTVQQTDRGYGWLLIESASGQVFVLKKSPRTYPRYVAALEAGYQELVMLSAAGMHQRPDPSGSDAAPQALPIAELQDAL